MIILMSIALSIILAFVGAFVYSTAWNWVVPTLFGLPKASMLQAYVVMLGLSLISVPRSRSDNWEEFMTRITVDSVAKMISTILITFIIKMFFL